MLTYQPILSFFSLAELFISHFKDSICKGWREGCILYWQMQSRGPACGLRRGSCILRQQMQFDFLTPVCADAN